MRKSIKKFLLQELLNDIEKNWFFKTLQIALIGTSSQKAILTFRLASFLHHSNFKYVSLFLFRRLEKNYGIYIGSKAIIKVGLKLPHPTGVIIGTGVKIGKGCTIYQQVTIGGAHVGDAQKNCYPTIANNVVIFAGAKIIGKVSVGSNCIIGANSVVTKDIPSGCIVAGVPARIIREHDKC